VAITTEGPQLLYQLRIHVESEVVFGIKFYFVFS